MHLDRRVGCIDAGRAATIAPPEPRSGSR